MNNVCSQNRNILRKVNFYREQTHINLQYIRFFVALRTWMLSSILLFSCLIKLLLQPSPVHQSLWKLLARLKAKDSFIFSMFSKTLLLLDRKSNISLQPFIESVCIKFKEKSQRKSQSFLTGQLIKLQRLLHWEAFMEEITYQYVQLIFWFPKLRRVLLLKGRYIEKQERIKK